jgi:hypothetical protein
MVYTASKKILWIGIVLSLAFLFWCSSQPQEDTSVVDIDKIAQCLWQKWVKMYGTETCSHCIDQKELFWDSFKYITYVDCAKDTDACAKLEGTPTWEFANWELLPGKQRISVLAEKAWCEVK